MNKAELQEAILKLGGVPKEDATNEVLEFQLKALQYEELKPKYQELEQENETLLLEKQQLEQQLEADEKKETSAAAIYKRENDQFQLLYPVVTYKGEKHKAEDAVKNEALMEELIDASYSGIKKI